MTPLSAALILAAALVAAPAARCQEPPPAPAADPEKQYHWALGAFFGTGWYHVDSNRSVFILRMPPRQKLRAASLEPDGRRVMGIELVYALSLGLSRLNELPDFIEFDNYSTISFTPGVILEVPVTPAWSLRPFVHLGYGWESQTQEGAFIGYGGVKSRYRLNAAEDGSRWSLLNGAYFAGYRPEYQDRGRFGALMAGVENSHPLGSWQIGRSTALLNTHVTYTWYFDELNFHTDAELARSFRDQWEVGLAVGRSGGTIDLGFLSFEQIGLAYRWSSDGNFDGILLSFRSPFTE